MRKLALLIAAQLSAVCVTSADAQLADSLPLGWQRRDTLFASPYRLRLDRQTRRGGLSSLRIQLDSGSGGGQEWLVQDFLAEDFRGRRVLLAGYLRLTDTTSRAGLSVRVEGSSAGAPVDNTLWWRRPQRTADWQRHEIVLDVPPEATWIRIGILFGGVGTAWIDDLQLSAVDSTVPATGRILPIERIAAPPPGLPRAPLNLDFEPARLAAVAQPPFIRREAMVPMRDGARLYTVIASPASASEPLPFLLERTPYGASPQLWRGLVDDGYILVSQDIRGRGRSEGAFVMNRPARDRRDSAGVDETTDAWDTVEWLLHNVAHHNGRVGVIGLSYPGWLAEVVLLDPHPAVRAVSPQAPMTDTWMGDDFFHQGAFRLTYGFGYPWGLEGAMVGAAFPTIGRYDHYDWYLSFGSLRALTDSTGAMRIPTWRRFVEHPAYDSVWQRRAFQRLVARLTVPTLNVGGWWDAEDLYGPQATYRALERLDPAGINTLVIGPWYHTQWAGPGGSSLGNLRFGSATSDSFLLNMQRPWFAYWLKDRGDGRFPEARLFDAGTNQWRTFDHWPPREAAVRGLYFQAGGRLSFDPPRERVGFDQYVSDPWHPVPYLSRPIGNDFRFTWWMTEDQRFADGRPDVLSWQTAPLEEDVLIAGDITARLFAATTGSDADWVVKLIDVYPDSVADRREMGGYQLMVAGDILRGRYRRSFERAEAIPPNAVQLYTVDLHQQLYTFRRGHRIMVQVQSTWFPLYDRNPQTFVPNIFLAPASAYRVQTHRIYRTGAQPSHVEVMVLAR